MRIFLIALAAIFALVFTSLALSARAQELPPHPFMGVALICANAPGGTPECGRFRSNGDFDTREQCVAAMTERTARTVELMQQRYPNLQFTSQFVCVPDTSQNNA